MNNTDAPTKQPNGLYIMALHLLSFIVSKQVVNA